MTLTKLTLSADPKLIREAKKMARKRGSSLSSIVSGLLRDMLQTQRHQTLLAKDKPFEIGPLTRQLSGLIKLTPEDAVKTDRELIEQAIAERHGL